MALHTDPINGNTIAPWVYTDFHQLFTGVMTDQPITFKPNVTMQAIGAAPAAPTAAATAGTGLGIGVYKYAVTFVTADGGETLAGAQASVTTTTGNQQVNLTAIPTGPVGATKRNVYRTAVGGSTLFLAATINDNTTTILTDSLADATLTTHAQSPAHPSFGGSLIIKDSTGVVQFQIFSDGSMSSGAGGLTVGNTTISGTLTVTGVSTFNGTIIGGAGTLVISSRQSGAASGVQFDSWNGTAQVVPFSVGGQFGAALTYVDNSGNIVVGGTLTAESGAIGSNGAGRWAAPTLWPSAHGSGTISGVGLFTGTATGTYTHGLNNSPVRIDAIAHVNGSQTMGYDAEGTVNVHITSASGLAFVARAWS